MSSESTFIPISYFIDNWPSDIVNEPEFLNKIGLLDYSMQFNSTDFCVFHGTLALQETISVSLLGIDGLQLEFLSEDGNTIINFDFGYYRDELHLNLKELSVSLLFDSDLLISVEKATDESGNVTFEKKPDQPVAISIIGASLSIDSSGNFEFDLAGGVPQFDVSAFTIGNTGIIVEINSISFILSQKEALNFISSGGAIEDSWRGIYINELDIILPQGLSDILPGEVILSDTFIGPGGFCGKITGTWTVDSIKPFDTTDKTLAGFAFRTESINAEFKQNALLSCAIIGYLEVPFFDAPVKVTVAITNDGDFTVAFDSTTEGTGLYPLKKDGVCDFTLSGLSLGKEDDLFYLTLSGSLKPKLGNLDWPIVEVKALTIYSNGEVHIDGGWIDIPDQQAFDFNGFKLEITRLGFGKDTIDGTDYNWIGFSGGIQIVNGLPLKGGVDGLKILWSSDGKIKLQISGVALSFEIENVLTFDGSAQFIDEEDNKGFKGGIKVSITPLNGLGLNAQFVAGKKTSEDYTYFYIFIDASLPVGIPLVPPVAGIYGLSGLFGYNMTFDQSKLSSEASGTGLPDMTDSANWIDQEKALAFGAGLTVGTLADNGFTIKVKALLAILLPGPIIMIQGKAKFLSVEEDYPLTILAILDVAAGTFLMNITAAYKYPKTSGSLIDISGSAEAFFNFNDPSAWHVYLGEDDPESARIQAKIISFFTAETYLMADNDMLKMGAWIGYELHKKYGPLKVDFEAWIDGKLSVSRMPLQAEGSLTIHGSAEVSACGISVGISVEASAKATAPNPLSVSAEVEVTLKTPLGNPSATISLEWEKTGTPGFSLPFASGGIQHIIVSEKWELTKQGTLTDADGLYDSTAAVSMSSGDFSLVPPDVQVILNFNKEVIDTNNAGGNASTTVGYEDVGDYEFKYELTGLTLEHRNNWSSSDATSTSGWSEDDITGSWQATSADGKVNNTVLILNANTPFEISRELENNESWLGTLLTYNSGYPCSDKFVAEWQCADFETYDYGEEFTPLLLDDRFIFKSDFPMTIVKYSEPSIGTTRALQPMNSYIIRICIAIAKHKTATAKVFTIDNVIIDGGKNAKGALSVELSKKRWNDKDGNTEIYFSSSLKGGKNKAASFTFPVKTFPDAPGKVYVTCMLNDNAGGSNSFLTAYNSSGKIVATAKWHKSTEPIVFTLESKNNDIRKVTIEGYGIIVTSFCFDKIFTTKKKSIDIIFPENMAEINVWLSAGSKGKAEVFDDDENLLKTIKLHASASYRPFDFKTGINKNVRTIRITGDFLIEKVCGLNEEEAFRIRNANSAITYSQETLDETWGSHTAALLQPNNYYRVKVNTKASRRKNDGDWTEEAFTEYLFFQTGNPAGIFISSGTPESEVSSGSEHYPERGALKDMSPYVQQTIPAETAANTPRQPAYRSYDIGMTFTESYVEQLYLMADYDINIRLLDNNGNPAVDIDGNEITFANAWGDNPELIETREEQQWKAIASADGCLSFDESQEEYCQNLNASSTDLLLDPKTNYTAQVQALNRSDDSLYYTIYTFAFTTSAYASFAHHIHSFADAAWDNYQLLDDETYSIDPTLMNDVITGGEEESAQFDQLMQVFQLGTRTLPEALEVLSIGDGTVISALLVESPEPIEWERCSIALSTIAVSTTITEFTGDVKIIGGSTEQDGSNLNSQYVDLLVMETIDLSGYVLKLLLDNTDGTTSTSNYYTFPEESNFLAGSAIRIFNGSDDGETATEYFSYFAGNSIYELDVADQTMQLLTGDEIIHSRIIYPVSAVSDIKTTLVRNADGTRLFVFADDFDNGNYRFDFTYGRDISSEDAAAPVLMRYGSSLAEKVSIEFSLPALLPN